MDDVALPPTAPDAAPFPAAKATAAVRMAVPAWIQLVGLPMLVLLAWVIFTHAQHAVITFIVAALIALLLNPIVRGIVLRLHVPRPLAVMFVFAAFASLVALGVFALASITVDQAKAIQHNSSRYERAANHKVDRLEVSLRHHGIKVHLRHEAQRFINQLDQKTSQLSGRALSYGSDIAQTVAKAFFNVVLVIVVTIYMLLDAPRIGRWMERSFPGERADRTDILFRRLERALLSYVRGQALASLAMGASAGIGLWLYGVTGIWPAAVGLAVPFGVFVAITEFAPSIGPLVGAIPPVLTAFFDGPVTGLLVAALFLLLHQIEGHIVVPKLMGSAIQVHPLLVIFGILAGAQIMGIGGILLALPLIAVGRELVLFVRERFELAHFPTPADIGATHLEAAVAAGAAAGAGAAVSAQSMPEPATTAIPAVSTVGRLVRSWSGRRAARRSEPTDAADAADAAEGDAGTAGAAGDDAAGHEAAPAKDDG